MIGNFKVTRKKIVFFTLLFSLIIVIILGAVSFTLKKADNDQQTSLGNGIKAEISEIEKFNSSDTSLIESGNTSEDEFVSNTFLETSREVTEEDSIESDDSIEHGWFINEFGYTYVYNDTGYVQFNYKSSALDRYVKCLDNISYVMVDSTNLYSITVPVATTFADIPREIYVMDDFYNQSQSSFVSTVSQKTNESIIHIPIINELESQFDNGEYVFFRTDNNWTSLGAYCAYKAFAETKGITPYPISNFKREYVGEYLGSFYKATESEKMLSNPDQFISYSNPSSVLTSLTVYDNGMVYSDYDLCFNDVNTLNAFDFYLGRAAARYEISSSADGGRLLIIGDSSAHPLIPYLTTHYSKIDLINPRNFKTMLNEFLIEHEYDDCLVICYSTNAVSGDFIPMLNKLTGVNNNE